MHEVEASVDPDADGLSLFGGGHDEVLGEKNEVRVVERERSSGERTLETLYNFFLGQITKAHFHMPLGAWLLPSSPEK